MTSARDAGCAEGRQEHRVRASGQLSFPGIGPDAAELIVQRGAVGIGIDSMGVDPGCASEFSAHQVTLPAGLWHLKGLVNLGLVPPRGARIVAAIPPSDELRQMAADRKVAIAGNVETLLILASLVLVVAKPGS